MIPGACLHGNAGGVVDPLPRCPHCGGSGRVPFESDDFPPGTNACCCTCGKCRQKHESEEVVEVVAGALIRDGRVWLAQRHASTIPEWSEAWCMTGGKVEPGETPQAALRREWREEADADVTVGALLSDRTHRTDGFARPYRVRTYLVSCAGEPRVTPAGGQRGAWWPVGALPTPRLPSTDHAFEDAPPVTVVGEDNPYGSDPRYALYDEPERSAGARLRRLVFGVRRTTYHRRTRRLNLCDPRWSAPAARARAAELLADRSAGEARVFVLLGRKVAAAFGLDAHPPFSVVLAPDEDGAFWPCVLLPHPSGRCREWNEPGAHERARALLRSVRPDIPWGEADGPPPPRVRRCANCHLPVPEGECPECGPGGYCESVEVE